MPNRKPLSLWIVVSLFLLSVAAVPLAGRWRRQPVAPPHTLTELAAILSPSAPSLHRLLQVEGRPENGLWIGAHPLSREQLAGLMRIRRRANQWQGVVYCERGAGRLGDECKVFEDEQLQGWGEYSMRIGPLVFFGDPVLLRRIHKAIFGHEKDESNAE